MANATRNTASRDPPRLSARDPCFTTVLVGEERERFVVHKVLLTYHSEFFRSALTGNSKEAAEQTVPLPEDDPETFEFFVHWMYHKDLPTVGNANAELCEEWMGERDGGDLEMHNLVELHVFANKYEVKELKVRTLDALVRHMQREDVPLPRYSITRYAYDNLPAGSALLRLLVDIHCCHQKSED